MGRRKKSGQSKVSPEETSKSEQIELTGAAAGLAKILEPGIGGNTISALNYIFGALFLCLLLMLLFAGAAFHYMILLGLACGLFLSVQYFLSEASKLKGVLDPSPEDLKRDPKAPYPKKEEKEEKTEEKRTPAPAESKNKVVEKPAQKVADGEEASAETLKKRRRKKKKKSTSTE